MTILEISHLMGYASSRKENLKKLSSMINSYDHSREMTQGEIELIRLSRSEGKSWGTISEEIFDKHGQT